MSRVEIEVILFVYGEFVVELVYFHGLMMLLDLKLQKNHVETQYISILQQ